MKAAFFDIKPFEKEYLENKIKDLFERYYTNISLNFETEISEKAVDAEIISVFIDSDLSCKVLEKFPNLKYIILRSTGFSHVDLLYAKERGIKVFNAPHYGDSSIAEYVFGLLFTISRNIFESALAVKNQKVRRKNFQGMELKGKNIGIIGLGAIGKRVYEIAKSFNMNPFYYDIKKQDGYSYLDFNEICQKSDVISINCPLTCETLHLFNENSFQNMKDGVIIINTARGEIIKTQDLYLALKSGKIGYAALDVVECEQILYDNQDNPKDISKIKENCLKTFYVTKKLLTMKNVLITPHSAYNTIEAQKRILDITVENLISLTKFTNGAKNLVLI